ncbi:DNA glycosylase AlkZ-like family protein [Cellulomonas shaoxiangyii]|uniref:Winged helix DNA-binding domain-containing protein n=1 Tax=Cellulomonas shaoxiangyii TaxID=2566013 RepID=A0A4P7SE89_9CELL|nr:crosslink repair DNA glycosylase YcaQ family protein [Cellulomonas shaoxiangyii]QCB92449.1 hypothetical protein E5225_01640 [Cellulomonas shaoxiangyii]TGY85652.1 hypothetical protein E5226_05745 [Cellulomonas shaoxiangyii]
MAPITWPGALAWRLRRQLLDPPGSTTPAGVVGALGAVAAQLDPAQAELGVRARLQRSARGDVARALADGSLVRTFAFRGAVHLMTPDDAAVHLALRASSRMWERPGWQSHYRLAPEDWPELRAAVRDALVDGPLTREQLASVVVTHPRLAHLEDALTNPSATLLKPLAWQGDVCLGPPRDGRLTLQRLDTNRRWHGLVDVDEAGPRAIETYLRAYAPASAANLHYWLGEGLGVRRAQLTRWLDRLGPHVRWVEVDDEPRLVLDEDLDDLAATPPSRAVRLLPRYDQWVLGPGTADPHVVPPALRPEVSRGADLVLVGGRVAGTWVLSGDTVTTTWAPDAPPRDAAAVDAEVARLAGLLGRPLRHAG